jgi:hypothetical protein
MARWKGQDRSWPFLFSRAGISIMTMTAPKFAIGELVDFDNRTAPTRKPTGPYEIVRVLPMEDGSWRSYRIKSVAEPFERIAKEYEIVPIAPEKPAETDMSGEAAGSRR